MFILRGGNRLRSNTGFGRGGIRADSGPGHAREVPSEVLQNRVGLVLRVSRGATQELILAVFSGVAQRVFTAQGSVSGCGAHGGTHLGAVNAEASLEGFMLYRSSFEETTACGFWQIPQLTF